MLWFDPLYVLHALMNNLLAIPSFGFVANSVFAPNFCDKDLKYFPQTIDGSLR